MQILIVDDELLARQAISNTLHKFGYNNVIQASDGIEAFELINRIVPDLVLADIRMPGMDGIELLKAVREKELDILFVFISGHDRFQYVQNAVKLGAFNYLLKPIDNNDLKSVLTSAEVELKKRRNTRENSSKLKIKLNQSIHFMRKHFIKELVAGTLTQAYIEQSIDMLEIKLSHSSYCVIIASIDNFHTLSFDESLKSAELTIFSIENIALELFSSNDFSAYAFEIEDGISFLVNFDNAPDLKQEKIMKICSEIREYASSFIKKPITIGIGTIVFSLSELCKSFEASTKAVLQRLKNGGNSIYCLNNDSLQKNESKILLDLKAEHDILLALEQCNMDSALKVIKEVYLAFIDNNRSYGSNLTRLNLQLILLIQKFLGQFSIDSQSLIGDEITQCNVLSSYADLSSIIEWYRFKLSVCFEAIINLRDKGTKKTIDKAQKFIIENISKELTLEAVASQIHMSSHYFSTVFKDEVGENFVDYVTNQRIAIARKLLKEGIHKVNEVSMLVGFNNVKYFYKVFKKRTGFTPSEYKDI